jgi:hypothetical protein
MKVLDKLKELFAKGPKQPKPQKDKEPQHHHHNHGSSTT